MFSVWISLKICRLGKEFSDIGWDFVDNFNDRTAESTVKDQTARNAGLS